MVVVYRVQVSVGTEWMNVWMATLDEGQKELAIFDGDYEARLDKVYVMTDREGLAAAMNLADANHTNFEGELVARTKQLEPTP